MKLVDLSHIFIPGMPVYPGDIKIKLEEICSIKKDGYTNHQLTSGMHTGTHIDAPLHFIPEGKKISEISIDRFYGPGKIIDVRGQDEIDVSVLKNVSIDSGDIVIFFTGHDALYGNGAYFENQPVLTAVLAQKLVDLGVKMVGIDAPGPDKYPFSLHTLLLRHEILILEDLTNLESLLNNEFELFAFPIKFDADAAFVRTVAKIK